MLEKISTTCRVSALTAAQLRAARAMLKMDQSVLAAAAKVSVETIKRLEGMEGPISATRVDTLERITTALENNGIDFLDANNGGAGVRWKPGWPRAPQ
jgi:hypothetical protein